MTLEGNFQMGGVQFEKPSVGGYGYFLEQHNTHKNPKFGKVRQVPIREFGNLKQSAYYT